MSEAGVVLGRRDRGVARRKAGHHTVIGDLHAVGANAQWIVFDQRRGKGVQRRLRGLVRQESVFDPQARSRAGALGLTQLMPATAKSLSRSVLRVRYRRAFLYDPSMNARLGAAYLRSLYDRFSDNPLWALAAYNGGPTRMARVLKENAGLPEDEVFESHPAYETRDYVRRVMLFAGSYRELYP